MNLIFLGAPGAGKGTQAARICEKFNIPHISTGDILRANIKAATPLGIKAKSIIEQGLLVPDEVVIGLIQDRLKSNDCQKGYVLDGFPRTIEQAKALNEFAKIDKAVNIVVNEGMVIERIAGRRMCVCGESYHISSHTTSTCDKCRKELYQREDDKPQTVKARIDVYNKQTAPLIEYYSNMNIIANVDGAQSVDKVFADIEDMLNDNN